MRLGIDFGTTRTVVACADRGNYPVIDFVDDAGDAASFIPSVAAERGGEICFGFDAVAADPSCATLRSFKRMLSNPDASEAQTVAIGSRVVPVADLVTMFLAYVEGAIRKRASVRRASARGPLTAVVAVPANALGAQRMITLDAFRRAGFEVKAMLNEPSAAGFEYTHLHRDTLSQRRDSVIVYDLGGGTFDASVVRMNARRHEVLATAGLARLGGDDFDAALAGVVLAHAALDPGAVPARAHARLREQCRVAKEALNPSSRKITIDLEGIPGAKMPEVTVAVSDFYDACAPLVERTIEAMSPLMAHVTDTATELGDIAGVYVVGGASELPMVPRALRQRFGRRVHRSPYPSAAVAIGLAIASDEGAGFELADHYARTFGVFREGEGGKEITFDPIFARQTALPARANGPVERTRDYRAAHNIGHFRFFECNAVDDGGKPKGDMALFRDVYFPFDPELAATDDLTGMKVVRWSGEGPHIHESYSLDENGIVDVRIRNVDSGYERAYRLGGA